MMFVSDNGKKSHLTSEDSSLPDGHDMDGEFSGPQGSPTPVLQDLGLADIDVDSCDVSPACKEKLVQLIAQYQSIFGGIVEKLQAMFTGYDSVMRDPFGYHTDMLYPISTKNSE